MNFLNQTLKDYGYDEAKNFATCQVADSASSNIRAAMLMGIPHLDCNNHTLNLEVKKMIKEDKPLNKMIESIHELMISIKRSLKKSALLRQFTHLHPTIENKTRWTSIYSMMNKSMRIFDVVRELASDDSNTIIENDVVTQVSFKRRAQKKTALMFEINQACLHLQKNLCNRAQGRAILNYIIGNAREFKDDPLSPFYRNKLGTRYIALGNHLSSSPTFESGLIKIQNGREEDMSSFEERACEPLLKSNKQAEPVEKASTLAQALKNRKRKASELQSESKYQASYILASACCVENHWSVADVILTKRRQTLSSIVFEALIFLRSNWEYVNDSLIVEAIKLNQHATKAQRTKVREDAMEEEEANIAEDDRNLHEVTL